jgi:hypothetical protein
MATSEIPKVGGTAVTSQALDIGKAWALSTAWVTVTLVGGWALLGICAQQITGATCASQDEHNSQEEPKQWNPFQPSLPISILTMTALLGSLPMETGLAEGTVGSLRVV